MVNPGRGEVALVVGRGVSMTLRFTTGALSCLQAALGLPHSSEGCAQLFASISAAAAPDLPAIAFCGVAPRDRAAVKEVGVMEQLVTATPEQVDAIRRAMVAAFPDPPPAKPGKPTASEPFSWASLKRTALRAGMSTGEFWDSTPREVYDVVRAAAFRQDQALATAWLGGAWSREGVKLPPLKDFVSDEYFGSAKPKANPDLVTLARAWGSNVFDEKGELIVAGGAAVEKQDVEPAGLDNSNRELEPRERD